MSRRQPVDFASWGSVKLPIYFSPLKAKVPAEGATGNGANGARALKPADAVRMYDSFVFYYYERGTRRKGRGPTLERAKAKAKNIAKRLAQEGDQTIELSQGERRVYVNARSILASHDLEVDSAARLLHDLLVRLNGASLQQAVDFFNAHGKDVLTGVKMEKILDAYMEDLERRGVGHHHKRDVTKFIGGFVRAFPSEPAVVHTKQIDLWLGQLGGKARNKNNARDKVIAFFNFMEQKGYLPKGGADVAKRTTPFHDPRPVITCEEDAVASAHDNDIYTPEELSRILEVSEPDERLTIELKAFSGLRSEELARLWWVLVNEKARYINITDAIAKVNQRAVPIFDNLQRRLATYPEAEKRDRVCKRWTSSNALYHVWKRVTDRAGLPYKKNGFRNSYISYRLAQTKDINLVAYESGNSPEMIRKYYLDLVTPEQAAAWFALYGETKGLGGSEELAREVAAGRLGRRIEHPDFWRTVLNFFAAHPEMKLEHVNPIVDFVHANKFAGDEVQTEDGIVSRTAPWPDFSMKGRTLKSILRLVTAWHSDLSANGPAHSFSWKASGIAAYRFLEKRADKEYDHEWEIHELLNSGALHAEGRAMRHCVYSYAGWCRRGETTIWSLRLRINGEEKRMVTIEVDPRRRSIIQARAKCNLRPGARSLEIIRQWADWAGIGLELNL